MSPLPEMLYLPDTLANWPWPRVINPHYKEISSASSDWFKTFKPFNERSQYAFDKCDFGRLSSLSYPYTSKDHLRTGIDLMNLFFLVDEYTDVESVCVVREMVDVVIDALNHPHEPRPKGEVILGEVARQFWERAIKTATPESQRWFLESFTAYLESVVAQASDRDEDVHRTVETYMQTRRENIGSRPSFVILALDMQLPDDIFYHPVLVELTYHITDLLILGNDIVSWNKEQAVGDDRHNLVTIVMRQFGLDVPSAMEWLARYHEVIEFRVFDCMARIPSWGKDVDEQIATYVYGLGNWVRSNDSWSFESGRYFGSKGREIQKTRYVPLLPKSKPAPNLHRENVVVPLVEL